MTCYFPASLYVDGDSWRRVPPTGIEMGRRLAQDLGEDTYLQTIARISGRSETSVAWLLSQNVVVPAGLLSAALRLVNPDRPQIAPLVTATKRSERIRSETAAIELHSGHMALRDHQLA